MAKLGSGIGTETKATKASNGSPAPTIHDFSELLTTSEKTTFDGEVLLHGPPGVGKTFFAATISEFWPGELPAKRKIDLHDVLWMQTDAGGTAGFMEQRISVPLIDVRQAIAKYGLLKGLNACMDLLGDYMAKVGPKYIVVDTISVLDKYIKDYYDQRIPVNDRGKEDSYWSYKQILALHIRWRNRLLESGARIIWCCHSKGLGDLSTNKDAAIKREAKAVPGGFDIVPDITGQSGALYTANASIQGVIKSRLVPGKERIVQRFFYPFGVNAHEGKSRFMRALKKEEGPNPNLREMYARVVACALGDETVTVKDDQSTNVYEE